MDLYDLYGCVNQLIPGGHHLVPPSSPAKSFESKLSFRWGLFCWQAVFGAIWTPRCCLLRGLEVGQWWIYPPKMVSPEGSANWLYRWLLQSSTTSSFAFPMLHFVHSPAKIRYFLARYLRFLPDVSRIVLAKHQLWGYSTTVTGVSVEMFFLLFAHGHGLEIL